MLVKRFLGQINCQNQLGEGVLWHPKEQALYWTDIPNKKLHICRQLNAVGNSQATPKDLPFETIDLPYRLGCFAFTDQDKVIVAGFDQGLALFNIADGSVVWLAQPELKNKHTRFNDGRADPKGRFWLGSMVENGEFKKLEVEQQGALYCVYFDQAVPKASDAKLPSSASEKAYIEQVLSGLHISNGVCFNADASLMYHSDSPSHKIYQYQLDAAGQVIERSLFAKFEKTHFPDGAVVDNQGNLWTALWGGACIACLNANGEELFRYPMPMTQPSCVCIGGPDNNLLFVTSAQESLSASQLAKQPRAGNILVYELVQPLGRSEPYITV